MTNTRIHAERDARGTFDLRLRTPYQCLSGLLALLMLVQPLAVPLAFADPTGESGADVTAGNVVFDRSTAGTTLINQFTDRAIIEYQSFDILAGETVQFIQPEATSAALNRIVAAVPTQTLIDGQLLANGQVYIVNPAGVVFGVGSVVDVGQLFAAAAAMSNEDFTAGINQFTGVAGPVENAGAISADVVALIGRAVENTGSITATDGLVMLAAGERVLIGDPAAGIFVSFTAEGAAAEAGPGVSNTGAIDAGPTGSVGLAASDLYALAFQQSGAGSVTAETVRVQAEDGSVQIGGTVAATNLVAQSGGDVALQADVTLAGGTLHLEADSPHRTGGADGTGSVVLDANVNAVTTNGPATLIGADFVLGAGASVDTGTGGINVARSRNADPLALGNATGAQLDDTELAALATTGTLTLGRATTAGANGDLVAGQTLVAEDLAAGPITRAAGSLTLVGSDTVALAGTVDVDAGSLTVDGDFSATGDLIASNDVTLNGLGTLNGAAQRIDAETGTLDANGTLQKFTAGNLAIAGGTAILLGGNVQTPGLTAADTLTFEDAATLDGTGDGQRIDAVFGSLVTAGLTKTAGDLNLGGDAGVRIGAVNAPNLVVQSGGDVRLEQDVTLTATGGVLHLEADSPHRFGGADGVGTLTLDAGVNAATTEGAATLIGADFVLGAGSSVETDGAAISVAPSRGADGLALGTAPGADLDDAELDAFVTTGTLTLGRATTAGDDGLGDGALTLTAQNVTVEGVDLGATNTALVASDLIDDGGVAGADLTTTGNLALEAAAVGGLDVANASSLSIVDTGPGAIAVTVTRAATPPGARTSVDVRNVGYGDVDVTYTADGVTPTGTVDVNDNLVVNDVNLDHDFTFIGQGGPVTLNAVASPGTVTVNAGANPITATQDLGTVTPLGAVAFTGSAINLQGVATTGSQTYTASTITASGAYESTTGDVLFPGDLVLASDTTVDAFADAIFGGTVETDGTAWDLDVDAGSNASFVGDVGDDGGANVLGDLIVAADDGIVSQADLRASGLIQLGNATTLLGAGAQRVDAGAGTFTAAASITKTTAGDLDLGGDTAINLAGDVQTPGAVAADTLSLEDAVSLNGGNQRIDAGLGTLDADASITKINAGNLNLAGDAGLVLGGDVQTTGATAADTLTLENAATLDGGDQRLDAGAGTLDADASVTKNSAGNLDVGGDAALVLGGDLVATGATAADTLTLENAVTLNGGDQRIDGGLGALDANGSLTKITSGTLDLGGDAALRIAGDVSHQNAMSGFVAIEFEDRTTLDGGNQRLDGGAGALFAEAGLNKTTPGDLRLAGTGVVLADVLLTGATAADTLTLETQAIVRGGDRRIDAGLGALDVDQDLQSEADSLALGGDAALRLGARLVSTGDVRVEDDVTADGGDQLFSALALDFDGDVSKATPGDLVLSGAAALRLGGDVLAPGAVDADFLIVGNTGAETTLDGGDQRIDSGAGMLVTGDPLLKTTGGDLTLAGDSIELRNDVRAPGAVATDTLTLEDDVRSSARIDAGAGRLVALSRIDNVLPTSTLILGGDAGIDLADLVFSSGSLVVEDAFTAAGASLFAAQDTTLSQGGTFDGVGNQAAIAGDTLRTGALSKTTAGDLFLDGAVAIDIDGTVDVDGGSLGIPRAFTAAGDLIASNDVTLLAVSGAGTLDGAATNQRIDAETGVLSAFSTLTKNAGGTLTLGGGAGIALSSSVAVNDGGSLVVEDDFTALGDLVAAQNVTLLGAGALNNVASQRIDAVAGTLRADSTLTKNGAGDLTLGGGAAIDLNGTVDVNPAGGNLLIEDPFSATRDLIAANDVTLRGAGTLDGDVPQRIDAQGGDLQTRALTKPTFNLFLSGATSILLDGNVEATLGTVTVEDAFTASGNILGGQNVTLQGDGTLNGGGTQRIDAANDNLSTRALTKATGDLELAGADSISLQGNVEATAGSLTVEDAFTATGNLIAGQNVTLLGAGTLNGAATNQRIDAVAGTLRADSTLTKNGAGNLNLGGGTNIDLNGTVDVNNLGELRVEDAFSAAGDLLAESHMSLMGAGTLDGDEEDQRIGAGDKLGADSTLTKTTEGDLEIEAGNGMNLGGTVDVQDGSLTLDGTFEAAGNLRGSENVTLLDAGTLDGGTSQRIDAEGGVLSAAGMLTKTGAGDLNLGGQTSIDLNGTVDVNAGSLTVEDSFSAAGDLLGSADVTLATGILDGGSQRVDAEGGTLDLNGNLTKSTGGNLTLGGATALGGGGGILVGGDVLTPGASDEDTLRFEDAATLDGGSQRVDAEAGALDANGHLTKTTAGDLTLGGAETMTFGGNVTTPGASDEDTLTFTDTATFDRALMNGPGASDQLIDAGEGALAADADLLKFTIGALTVMSDRTIGFTGEGDQRVYARGDLTLQAADPTTEFSSIFKETGNLTIGTGTVNGSVNGGGADVTTASKISVADGNLTIAANGTANVSDLAARGALQVTALAIVVDDRSSGPSFEVTGTRVNDLGPDFVGSKIAFNVAPTGGSTISFGTPTGTEVNSVIQDSSALKRALTTSGDPLTAAAFADPSGAVRDLTPVGGSTDDPASDIAAILADLAIEPVAPTLADASSAGQTRADDVLEFLDCFPLEGQTQDLPESCDPEEYGVAAVGEATPPVGATTAAVAPANVSVAPALGSVARPATTPQMNALRIYRDLRAKPVVPVLGDAVASYKSSTGAAEVKGAEFRRYLETAPDQAEAVTYLNSMRGMVGELRQAGMTPAQFLRAAQKVVEEMTPEGISPAELGVAIEAGGQAGWPPLYLEQEEVAELLGD